MKSYFLTVFSIQIIQSLRHPSFSNKLADMRNFAEYSGAEEWLRQTYPHLHAAWLQTFSNLENFNMMNMQLTCMVCQIKPSSGLHYGVKMCEADKQFLKRTFHYQIVYSKCGKEGECPPRPRGWCQICRLGRCLSTPVTISMIRIGNKSLPVKQTKKEAAPLFTIKVEVPTQVPQVPLQPSIVSKEEIPCQPLDLRIPRKKEEAELMSHDYSVPPSDHHIQNVPDNYDKPVDLSSPSFNKDLVGTPDISRDSGYGKTPSPILDTIQVLNTPPSFHTDKVEATDILRPSSRHSSYGNTPTPLLETIQALNTPPSSLSPILDAIQLLNTPPSFYKDKVEYGDILRLSPRDSSYGRSLSPILDAIQALNNPPSFLTDQVESADLSGSSSRDASYRLTPSSILDASQALNKLTLNSAVLGEALSRIHGNISMLDSLLELSSISDILSETSREL